jgi:hypothetical protein
MLTANTPQFEQFPDKLGPIVSSSVVVEISPVYLTRKTLANLIQALIGIHSAVRRRFFLQIQLFITDTSL